MEGREKVKRAEYLSRIGVDESDIAPDERSLRLLQRQHLLTVPFENLDIHWKRPIVLDTDTFYKKIVEEDRGGFCYELNGLFNELLSEIGFETRIVSARVGDGKGNFSPEYDHAAIIVTIGEDEYLTDVGFGAFTAVPLRFVPDVDQTDDAGIFVIRQADDGYFEATKKEGDGWRSEYIFKPLGHDLSEFSERCDFQQYSPDSHFIKGKICSLMTKDGRKTLTDKSFIVTVNGERKETEIVSEEEFDEVLKGEFGISKD
jgi:N-hydroxyarylamine O-acetyltransferase